MTHQIEETDPLASAVAQLREELVLWIDTELARLHEHVDEQVREEERAAFAASQEPLSTSRFHQVKGNRPVHNAATDRVEPSDERLPARELFEPTVITPAAYSSPSAEAESPTPVPNPRQRLDALARLLDHRLKQAHEEAESKGSGRARPDCDPDDPIHSTHWPEGCR